MKRREPTPKSPTSGVSRRSFIQTVGLSAAGSALAGAAEAHAAEIGASDPDTLGPGPIDLRLRINGNEQRFSVEPGTTLMEVLRWHAKLTGTKEVCDRGSCGCCSVLIDGTLVVSCMMLATDAQGSEIVTVEGLASGDSLDPVQVAFIKHDALQCGYCTPGLIMASKALLSGNAKPTLAQIKKGLAGNICRCGTYNNVFNAVLEASGQQPVTDASREG